MNEELVRLRALLKQEQGLREEEQRRREEEQRRREEAEQKQEEEQRRRESAEIRAEGSRLQSLRQYLESCHSLLSLAIHVETDPSSTTQGDTTNPTGRVFPRRIIPWHDFPARQENIWGLLAGQPFCDHAIFPSPHQLDYVATLIKPIASETDLRHFARDTVEIAVQKLVDAAYDDDQLRAALDIQGSVTFESHTNLGGASVSVDALTESVHQIDMASEATGATPLPLKPSRTRAHRKTKRGKSGPADQFCVYRRSDGRNVPALAIEYKAPHKLTRDEVVAGLQGEGEIQPERDVINIHGEGFDFASKWLVAAVVTQLFSYMVDKGIQYGYVCTGETFVFLHIPQDPSLVYYSVCVPNLDAVEDDDNRLHRTAVAQVFAFVLQALRSLPPPQDWHDRAQHLGIWDVEFEDVLRDIPQTDRKPPRDSPLYKPPRWKGFVRSPIKTRSRRCRPGNSDTCPREKSDSDDEDSKDPPSPSALRSSRSSAQKSAPTSTISSGARRGDPSRGRGAKTGGKNQRGAQTSIRDRPFCTHKCLLGLANGGAMDDRCPNLNDHQPRHIEPSVFRHLLRDQLAKDRGADADAMPIYLSGSVGALFKVRLSSHGYTLLAKGVEESHLTRLRHEYQVYDWLSSIQGQHVPVCLGEVDLVLPYYYDGGVFTHFLFLSWAGRPMFDIPRGTAKDTLINMITKAFRAIHKLKVLHRDAEPRNVLYDAQSGNVMVVDFERAELVSREPLGVISPNRKRKHAHLGKRNRDEFAEELSSIVLSVQRCIK
ncbi:hypothetical protein F5Y09DRAFT_336142 [Xylaria sp. FL1042]|nr:hypothetical protein F5Y09DRAFT_336142 [Xylaria sp. FL1042]